MLTVRHLDPFSTCLKHKYNRLTEPSFRYEVFFRKEVDCGGAYIKLLSHSDDLRLVMSDIITAYNTVVHLNGFELVFQSRVY